MASILKVDAIQKPNGSAFTAADLGWDVSGSVVQTVAKSIVSMTISVPHYTNDKANLRNIGQDLVITPKYSGSHILLLCSLTINNSNGSHTYFDVQRNGSWLVPDIDAMWSSHDGANTTMYVALNHKDTNPTSAGSPVTYSFWVGDWGGAALGINNYHDGNTNAQGRSQIIAMELIP